MKRPLPHLLTALTACLATGGGASGVIDYQPFEFSPPTYVQRLSIEFKDEASARAAEFRILPLFENHHRAISCRWDDNWLEENLNALELMRKHGIRGTWYLNADDSPYMRGVSLRPVAHHLLEGGNSIGSHTAAHPYTIWVNRNRQFEELLSVRIEWESFLDTHVNSYATAFIDFRNDIEGDQSQADLILNLERAGLYHAAEFTGFHDGLASDLQLSVIMPPENAPFEIFRQGVDWAMSDPQVGELYPLISNSMHAWYRTDTITHAHYTYGIEELDRRLEYLAALPDVWHTNQNAYAAYRFQYRNHDLRVVSVEDSVVTLELERPVPSYLNDRAPVTLGIAGTDREAVVGLSMATGRIEPSRRVDPHHLMVNVGHDDDRPLPVRVDSIGNRENTGTPGPEHASRDFPGISGLLSIDENHVLTLQIANDSDQALEKVEVTWRNALGWRQGLEWTPLGEVPATARAVEQLALEPSGRDGRYHSDVSYFVAQVDFVHGGIAGRLYFTCHRVNPRDPSLPKEGFLTLGPIPREEVNRARLDAFLASGADEYLTNPGGQRLFWRINEGDGPVPHERYDSETIPTQADWFPLYSPGYLLASTVTSPVERTVRFICHEPSVSSLYLNAERVEGFVGTLLAGENDLRLVYFHEEILGTGRQSACFFRIADVETGQRITDIAYRRPPVPGVQE